MTDVARPAARRRLRGARPPAADEPLRTDIAMFVGRARGAAPVGEPVRIDGWRSFLALLAGCGATAATPYAVKGYFDNGGEIAWIWRLGDPATSLAASTVWTVGSDVEAAALGFPARQFAVTASSAGIWGNRLRITIRLQRRAAGAQRLDLDIEHPDEGTERLRGVPVDDALADGDRRALGADPPRARRSPAPRRPRRAARAALAQAGSSLLPAGPSPRPIARPTMPPRSPPRRTAEPSLLAFPDLPGSLADDDQRREVLAGASRLCAETLDRLLIADLPETIDSPPAAESWIAAFGDVETLQRTTAAYHPWIVVEDPLAPPLGAAAPPAAIGPRRGRRQPARPRARRVRPRPPTPRSTTRSISRAGSSSRPRPGSTRWASIPCVCQSGRGLVVWGGRTLGGGGDPLRVGAAFVAHRRLIHRLVRAIRRTARPLVFETNGPVLWLRARPRRHDDPARSLARRRAQGRAPRGGVPRPLRRRRSTRPEMSERGRVICEIASRRPCRWNSSRSASRSAATASSRSPSHDRRRPARLPLPRHARSDRRVHSARTHRPRRSSRRRAPSRARPGWAPSSR